MMWHFLCPLLLLVFLTGGAVVLVTASDHAINCGYDISCHATLKLTTAVSEMKKQLDERSNKQAIGLEELKANLNKSLDSTAAIFTQLEKLSVNLLRHDERLKALEISMQGIQNAMLRPSDCSEIREIGYNVSGVYRVYPTINNKRIEADVYCDFKSVGESWLVFQRRKDGSVDFYRNWNEYANGFGDPAGEFWLGNEKLSPLTTNKKYKLRIELVDFFGEKRYAEYSTFIVRPSTDKYRLIVGGYSGNAGDSLAYHNQMRFTAKDQDNDPVPSLNCGQRCNGGWWFRACHLSNLNGLFNGNIHSEVVSDRGINWHHWKGFNSLKATEMKITASY